MTKTPCQVHGDTDMVPPVVELTFSIRFHKQCGQSNIRTLGKSKGEMFSEAWGRDGVPRGSDILPEL